jgi:TatA/E family protein of Tat protein translocase
MFGVGHLPELILILILALIFVGPGKLPLVGSALGKSISQFKKAANEDEADGKSIEPAMEASSTPVREISQD